MFSGESLVTVTLVVVHHIHTSPIVAAGYTKTIIYVYRRKRKNSRFVSFLSFSDRMKHNLIEIGMDKMVREHTVPHM